MDKSNITPFTTKVQNCLKRWQWWLYFNQSKFTKKEKINSKYK
jgi:hypothetical protein